MSQATTKTYRVGLIKGFAMPTIGHRRAGYHFMPNDPQEVELTAEQVKLIEADPSLEFVDENGKPLKKSKEVKAATGDSKAPATPDDTTGKGNGREYDDDTKSKSDDGGDAEDPKQPTEGDEAEPVKPETVKQLKDANNKEQLLQIAKDEDVEVDENSEKAEIARRIVEARQVKAATGEE